jgi:hypothetical protein
MLESFKICHHIPIYMKTQMHSYMHLKFTMLNKAIHRSEKNFKQKL